MTTHSRALRRRRGILVAALLVLLPWLAACGGAGNDTTQQTVDGVTFALERPAQIALLEDYAYVVTLTDSSGAPINGATVFLEQDMPAMPMGSNQPLAEPLGDGKYRITGVFTMEGAWIVKIHAMIGGKEYVATFDQQVTLQK